jgi:hypothetical protein
MDTHIVAVAAVLSACGASDQARRAKPFDAGDSDGTTEADGSGSGGGSAGASAATGGSTGVSGSGGSSAGGGRRG